MASQHCLSLSIYPNFYVSTCIYSSVLDIIIITGNTAIFIISICYCLQIWLSSLATEMKATLQNLLRECLSESRKGPGLDPVKFPSQILGLAEQILFTSQCEEAIMGGSLQQFKIEMEQKLESYTSGYYTLRKLINK